MTQPTQQKASQPSSQNQQQNQQQKYPSDIRAGKEEDENKFGKQSGADKDSASKDWEADKNKTAPGQKQY